MLTLAVMIVLTPLTLKGTRSMMIMQALQPEMKKLQAQYKDDRQKLNEELLKFYRENNINPLGGCLPLLIQLPVFLILYRVIAGLTYIPAGQTTFQPKYLDTSSELYRSLLGADGDAGFRHEPRRVGDEGAPALVRVGPSLPGPHHRRCRYQHHPATPDQRAQSGSGCQPATADADEARPDHDHGLLIDRPGRSRHLLLRLEPVSGRSAGTDLTNHLQHTRGEEAARDPGPRGRGEKEESTGTEGLLPADAR